MAAPSGTAWGSVVTGNKSTRKGRIGLYISRSSTETVSTVTVQVWFWSMYSVNDDANSFYYDADTTSASTLRGSVDISHSVSTGDGWSTSNQTKLGTYTHSYTRGTSSQTKYFAAKLADIDVIGTMTVYSSISIPALSSYKVSYNANGGSGAPSSQTKWHGTTLKLSSTKPTRTGYTFQGWGTSASDTSVDYAAGANYTSNAAITLYAIWKANTYAVKYNANGGSGAPSQQTKTYGKTLTLSSTKPTRTNYNFKGWGTSASATTVSYAAGASYTKNAAITLYAVWELAYWNPKITSFTVSRCTSDGTSDSVGTYALVKFKWECCQLLGDNNVSAITVVCNGVTTTVSASGTSGTISQIVGDGALSVEESYSIEVTVADSKSGSSSLSKTLPTASFPIDVLAGGTGIAFGKVAETAKTIETPWPIQSTHTDNGFVHVHGTSGAKVTFGVGVSGTNHGIYSSVIDRWLIYSNGEASTMQGLNANYIRAMYNGENNYAYLEAPNVNGGTTLGYGSYKHGNNTSIYGKNVYINSTDAGLSGRAYGVNKVLWTGEWFMTSGHTATLSEAVSAQPHGIVLIWSGYASDKAQNYNYNFVFVPKHYVKIASGYGVACYLTDGSLSLVGNKYVYVHDTKVVGNDNNNVDGTNSTSGITKTNTRYVLRYVIGV